MRIFECKPDVSWAIYSYPGETTFRFIQSLSVNVIQGFNCLSSNLIKGYFICPFNINQSSPILIPGNEENLDLNNFQIIEYLKSESEIEKEQGLTFHLEAKKNYLLYVKSIINSIQTGNMQKCVAARKHSYKIDSKLNWKKSLIEARKKYPHTFCSLIWHSDFGLWLTASPELLFEMKKNFLKTHSLAGTKKINENWSSKENIEQNYVTDFIIKELKKHNAQNIKVEPTTEIQIGELSHLINKIECNIETDNFSKIIEDFHPTPAMCGTPKVISFNKILKDEMFKRELFSGFQGPIKNDSLAFYVTIRCAKSTAYGVDLYAGAGITSDSNPEKEWEETENKMNIIKSVLI